MLSPELIPIATILSWLLGWLYFLSWSLSFYPQPILNFQRRSTKGTTPSYPTINFFGFVAYLVSNCALYASPLIRSQYGARNPLSPKPTVRLNDLAFGIHAVVLTAVTLSTYSTRIWGFKQGCTRIGRGIWGVLVGCLLGVLWTVGMVWVKKLSWIDVIYVVGYCKLVITTVKYIPQAWANYQSQSTEGWCIEQVLLDLAGGILSMLQLVIDSSMQHDWSGLFGNPVKLGLGNISIFFDVVFMVQHYILYRRNHSGKASPDGERRRLLGDQFNEVNA